MTKKLTPSDEDFLFVLIKSLTDVEKKNIQWLLNGSTKLDEGATFLFAILNHTHEHDKIALKQKLTEARIKIPLPKLKNYLKEIILKTLRFYHADDSADTKILHQLLDVQILHNKGLTTQRDKSLLKAKKLATYNAKKYILPDILNKEYLYKGRSNEAIVMENKNVLNTISIHQEYRQLLCKKDQLMGLGEIRDEDLKSAWGIIINHPLMNETTERNSFEEKLYYHQIIIPYYLRINDFEKMLTHLNQMIDLLEQRIASLPGYHAVYLVELNTLLICYCKTGNFVEAIAILSKLIQMQDRELNKEEKTYLHTVIPIAYSNVIEEYLFQGFYTEAFHLAETLEMLLKTKAINNNNRKEFVYLMLSKVAFYKKDYEKAFVWNNQLLESPIDKDRAHFHVLSIVFNLIILFELQDFDTLEQKIRTTTLFLQKRKRLFATEKLLLKYLRNKFPKSYSYRETLSLFKEMKNELDVIRKDPYEAKAFEYFNYSDWLQSKIENKTLLEIVGKGDELIG